MDPSSDQESNDFVPFSNTSVDNTVLPRTSDNIQSAQGNFEHLSGSTSTLTSGHLHRQISTDSHSQMQEKTHTNRTETKVVRTRTEGGEWTVMETQTELTSQETTTKEKYERKFDMMHEQFDEGRKKMFVRSVERLLMVNKSTYTQCSRDTIVHLMSQEKIAAMIKPPEPIPFELADPLASLEERRRVYDNNNKAQEMITAMDDWGAAANFVIHDHLEMVKLLELVNAPGAKPTEQQKKNLWEHPCYLRLKKISEAKESVDVNDPAVCQFLKERLPHPFIIQMDPLVSAGALKRGYVVQGDFAFHPEQFFRVPSSIVCDRIMTDFFSSSGRNMLHSLDYQHNFFEKALDDFRIEFGCINFKQGKLVFDRCLHSLSLIMKDALSHPEYLQYLQASDTHGEDSDDALRILIDIDEIGSMSLFTDALYASACCYQLLEAYYVQMGVDIKTRSAVLSILPHARFSDELLVISPKIASNPLWPRIKEQCKDIRAMTAYQAGHGPVRLPTRITNSFF
jgi:hypothetical protein